MNYSTIYDRINKIHDEPYDPDMDILAQLEYTKKLWQASMPPQIDLPPDPTFISWITSYDIKLVHFAVIKTAKKMQQNLKRNVTLENDAAPRYCSSVMYHMREAKEGNHAQ